MSKALYPESNERYGGNTIGLRRGRRLRPRNPARAAKAFERAFGSEARLLWIRYQPCATCGAPGPSENSHVRSRGAGGTADDVIPQCSVCHRELHDMGVESFAVLHGLDVDDLRFRLAGRYAALWRKTFSRKF